MTSRARRQFLSIPCPACRELCLVDAFECACGHKFRERARAAEIPALTLALTDKPNKVPPAEPPPPELIQAYLPGAETAVEIEFNRANIAPARTEFQGSDPVSVMAELPSGDIELTDGIGVDIPAIEPIAAEMQDSDIEPADEIEFESANVAANEIEFESPDSGLPYEPEVQDREILFIEEPTFIDLVEDSVGAEETTTFAYTDLAGHGLFETYKTFETPKLYRNFFLTLLMIGIGTATTFWTGLAGNGGRFAYVKPAANAVSIETKTDPAASARSNIVGHKADKKPPRAKARSTAARRRR